MELLLSGEAKVSYSIFAMIFIPVFTALIAYWRSGKYQHIVIG
jgi:hypothetical protein